MEKMSDYLVDGLKGSQGIVRESDLGNREESSALSRDRPFWEAESFVCQKMYWEQEIQTDYYCDSVSWDGWHKQKINQRGKPVQKS